MLSLLYIGLLNGGETRSILLAVLLAAVEVSLFLIAILKLFRRVWAFGPALLGVAGGVLLICLHTVWRGWNAMGPLALVAYELLGFAILGLLLGGFLKKRKA